MERMDKGDLLYIGTAYIGVHTFKGKDYVTVRDFYTATNSLNKRIQELEEENRKLKEELKQLEERYDRNAELYKMLLEENKKLRVENEYLHKLLPEADGYVIEKQLEKRLWNDGEEDVYEDWGE